VAERAKRKPNWILDALVCGGVVASLVYSMATATEARSTTEQVVQWVVIAFGTAGLVWSLAMLARSKRKPG
jgi:hypothetical protein